MATPEPESEPEMAVYLASKGAAAQTEGINNAAIGYSALTMGVIVAGAVYFFKRNSMKKGTVDKSSLLENDNQVWFVWISNDSLDFLSLSMLER